MATSFMNVFPLPNRLGVDPTYNYQYQYQGTDSRNDQTIRIDYNISNNWKFYFRPLQNSENLIQSGGLNVNNTIGVGSFQSLRGTISGAGTLTTIITPTLTNEFNYGNTRNWLPNVPLTGSSNGYLRANYRGDAAACSIRTRTRRKIWFRICSSAAR